MRKHGIGATARQGLVEIGHNRRIELQLALINQLHHRIGNNSLGQRGSVHHGIDGQGVSVDVADPVGLHVDDAAMIDDRDGHAPAAATEEVSDQELARIFRLAGLHWPQPILGSSRERCIRPQGRVTVPRRKSEPGRPAVPFSHRSQKNAKPHR